jgi:valyl-tRNA synthetase
MSEENPQQSPAPASADALPKAYDPSVIEQRWADYWVREKLFDVPTPTAKTPGTPSVASSAMGEKEIAAFTMLLPPPNVTGRLHMGHMLNQTEMDILTRWHRMKGDISLWVPGTDHAGIATQMMVERQLAAEGTGRKALGREAFTARVWEWKQQYGSAITDQMRRLGASVDWSREYFTMDNKLNVAVKEAFVRLYEQGLIYRGAYIVNWDPVLGTAVSDLEVESEERAGHLYHIRYPFAGASGPFDETNSIVVATTRPETMLGDAAVAVNPNDARYKHIIGTMLQLPLTQREIPIVADDWAKPEFGTGAVKVTPAHDPNDFAIGKRHNLPSPSIMDTQARISLEGSPYHGLDRFEARERIVADLKAAGHLVAIKDHTLTLPVSQRTGAVIEPRLSTQWFIAVQKQPSNGGPSLADQAIAAVRDGHVRFTPENYSKTYFEWMNNLHDWCISRQLWWGHRIPAWHCDACHHIVVARNTPTKCTNCGSSELRQETDVLDMWVSSGLLPFTVFGWDGTDTLTPDLAAFYPTQLLVTGFDIIFFWVARMIMLSCHLMAEVPMPDGSRRALADTIPFREVYIHALVRDANREKMSKTKGNVIDPIEIITKYGTDAVRFTLASQASPGTDIAFNEGRTEGNRAFANKIWNAARFLFMNLDRAREAGYDIHLPTNAVILNEASPAQQSDAVILSEAKDPEGLGPATTAQPFSTSNPALELPDHTPLESRWIFARLHAVSAEVERALTAYRFDEAASAIYQFFWGEFCDWYLELVKLRLLFDIPVNDDTAVTLASLVTVFEAALRLLSPFMPFLTEEIWHALYNGAPPAKSIALARYPQAADFPTSDLTLSAMATMQELITSIRTLRKDLAVPEKESTPIALHADARVLALTGAHADMLGRLARVSAIEFSTQPLTGNNARSTATFDVAVLYERQIDIPAERERLTKDLAKYEKGLATAERQLNNESFTAKAPPHIIEGLRKQAAETRTLYDKAKAALGALDN